MAPAVVKQTVNHGSTRRVPRVRPSLRHGWSIGLSPLQAWTGGHPSTVRPPRGAVTSPPGGCRAMATEEKKPETEAARAQPTPSSSAAQSKVHPRGPQGTTGPRRLGDVRKCCFKRTSLFSLPTDILPVFTPNHIPSQCFLWAVLGMPHLSPGEGTLSALGLDDKSLCGTQTTSPVKLPSSGPTVPCGGGPQATGGSAQGRRIQGSLGRRTSGRVGG